MYPSDYGYATSGGATTNRETCLATALSSWQPSSVSDCKNNDWLLMNSGSQWTLTSDADSSFVFYVSNSSLVSADDNSYIYSSLAIRPSVYLTSNIGISGGEGSSTSPYIMKVSTN